MIKEFTFKLKLSDEQRREIQTYIEHLSVDLILFGLRFAYNRDTAISGGYLMPGRKSIVKRETHMLSSSQAKWRIDNWKAMIKSYRDKGYSYPTISRIKKQVKKISLDRG